VIEVADSRKLQTKEDETTSLPLGSNLPFARSLRAKKWREGETNKAGSVHQPSGEQSFELSEED